MTEINPETVKEIESIWIDKAKEHLRIRITRNVIRINSGYFSDTDLAFAAVTKNIPETEVVDQELQQILNADDIYAWNSYIAINPETVHQDENRERLTEARQALEDHGAVVALSDLGMTCAVEAVIKSREEEVQFLARGLQAALQAAAKHGFPI